MRGFLPPQTAVMNAPLHPSAVKKDRIRSPRKLLYSFVKKGSSKPLLSVPSHFAGFFCHIEGQNDPKTLEMWDLAVILCDVFPLRQNIL